MPHAKHDAVRARYHMCCGYCSVAEAEAGGELTVDHYVPTSFGGGDDDDNLVYACIRCNQYKGDFRPTEQDLVSGRIVLHPLRDDVGKHLVSVQTTGRLEHLSETGRFHITLLHLNRPALVDLRVRRYFYELLRERRRLMDAENAELRAIIELQEKYIAHLKTLIEGNIES